MRELRADPSDPHTETRKVTASAPGHARVAVWRTRTERLEALDQDLTLRSAGSITGVVVEGSGQPIVGASVSAAAAVAELRVETAETTTEPRGASPSMRSRSARSC